VATAVAFFIHGAANIYPLANPVCVPMDEGRASMHAPASDAATIPGAAVAGGREVIETSEHAVQDGPASEGRFLTECESVSSQR
jgi:hypothetical protein